MPALWSNLRIGSRFSQGMSHLANTSVINWESGHLAHVAVESMHRSQQSIRRHLRTRPQTLMREVEGRWGSGVLTRMLSRYWHAGLFVIDSHSKKRPHNLIFGRMFDHRLYDMLELGVESVRSIKSFGKAGVSVQAGNKVKPQRIQDLQALQRCVCRPTMRYPSVAASS